jgi:hyaluronoglucosaminidase
MRLAKKSPFLKGVIEGFYGRPWSFETRMAYSEFLPHLGMNTYIYCPKADSYLRKQWQEPWPEPMLDEMKALAVAYANKGLNFGVGLSPFSLYKNYDLRHKGLLEVKIGELNQLDAPLLAVLFDDMPGDLECLAATQTEIVSDILQWTNADRVMVCPTYYSFDPVLEKFFGKKPTDYWQQLGRNLPAEVDILWTGNGVCSDSVCVADIEAVEAQLGRQVTLWDNYPVNDGAQRSNFLYGEKLAHRDKALSTRLGGHLCNPMNQGIVSLLALQGMSEIYDGVKPDDSWLREVWGGQVFDQLAGDIDEFQRLGLQGMGSERSTCLSRVYGLLPGPAAREVEEWLRGEYAFDPACLTD